MELGNMLFGNSRGEFEFPNRDLVNSKEWVSLCDKAEIHPSYCDPEVDREFYGFDNEMFTIRPYYWGDDEKIAELPNFLYKPTGFIIKWYKYAFRDAYMNTNLNTQEILDIFKECEKSIKTK